MPPARRRKPEPRPELPQIPDDPGRFDQAVRAFEKRIPFTKEEWESLLEEERAFAFTVADVAQADVVAEVYEAIGQAVRDGTTLEEFKAQVGEQLEEAWGREDPARLETIFRTNVQTAYNEGRYAIYNDPEVKKARPYWRWEAIDDDHIDDECAPLVDLILPADDPFWETHVPPLHFNCFVPSTVVQGAIVGGLKARYAGDVIEVRTVAGRSLTVTPNHPVLTPRGFLPAQVIREGDDLVCYADEIDQPTPHGHALHEHHRPTRIDEVFEALGGDARASRVTVSEGDLHGDAVGVEGQVDVVGADRALGRHRDPAVVERRAELALEAPDLQGQGLARDGARGLPLGVVGAPTASGPRATDLAHDARAVAFHGAPLRPLRFGAAAHIDARLAKPAGESGAADAELVRKLLDGSAGAVALDRVRSIERRQFSGHVYDLQSVTGWIVADGIVASNCRCTFTALDEEEAMDPDNGRTDEAPDVEAAPGFGAAPDSDVSGWEPDPDDYPKSIGRELERRTR